MAKVNSSVLDIIVEDNEADSEISLPDTEYGETDMMPNSMEWDETIKEGQMAWGEGHTESDEIKERTEPKRLSSRLSDKQQIQYKNLHKTGSRETPTPPQPAQVREKDTKTKEDAKKKMTNQENKELKSRIKTLEAKLRTQQESKGNTNNDENQRLELTIRNQNNMITELRQEIKETKEELVTAKTCNTSAEDRMTSQNKIILQLQEQLRAVKNENKIVNEENDDLVKRVATRARPTQTKVKALMLADSNGRELRSDLENQQTTEWTFSSGTFKFDMCQRYLNDNTVEIERQDAICILLGTNHIKEDQTADTIFDKLKNLTRKIPETPIIIMEIPPVRDNRKHNNETKIYNSILETYKKELPRNTSICKYRETISAHPLEEIMRDNLHLRQGTATQIIASAIETSITQTQKPTTQSTRKPAPRTPTHSKTIDVPAEKAGLVIGKQGINLKTWQTKNNVTIDRNGDRDRPALTISGEISDVQATIKTIKALYTSDERRERRRDQSRSTTTCKFFLQGHCKKGHDCDFEHPDRRQSRSDRSRSPYRR